ncbi:MAG: hypothetical protein PHI12_07750 [Dehalococcoidales bacterium]|nr:hypothetical protein [Dehalococcoidales bacterium]
MGSRNYLLNVNDLSVTDRGDLKLSALAAGLERCAIKGIGDCNSDIPGLQAIPDANKIQRVQLIKGWIKQGNWPQSITQRELTPNLNGDLVAATALDSWLTAALAAVGTFYTCFQAIVSPQLAQDKLMVLYGASVDSVAVPMPVSRMVIRRGGAAGNIIAQYDMEEQMIRQDVDFFFSEPQVIDPQQAFAIQVRARVATAAAEIVHVHNFLFEQSGLIVT